MFKKRLLLIIIFAVMVITSITTVLIMNYLDPYINTFMSVLFLLFSFILSVSCFFTILLYLIKKIHYRWDVYIYHVLISFRQWFFISLFFVWLILFHKLWASLFITWWLLLAMFVFFDLFLKNINS